MPIRRSLSFVVITLIAGNLCHDAGVLGLTTASTGNKCNSRHPFASQQSQHHDEEQRLLIQQDQSYRMMNADRGQRHERTIFPNKERVWDRRSLVFQAFGVTTALIGFSQQSSQVAWARTPGSTNVKEAIEQIRDAAQDLKGLQNDWSQYAVIDAEGRAGNTDGARRILGGIAPQGGTAAIEVAKSTPCYRLDGAFAVIRKAVLADSESWTSSFDLLRFDELAEQILFAIQTADSNFYSVLFAQKGTTQIDGIFAEAKSQVRQGIADLNEMVQLLQDVNAPVV